MEQNMKLKIQSLGLSLVCSILLTGCYSKDADLIKSNISQNIEVKTEDGKIINLEPEAIDNWNMPGQSLKSQIQRVKVIADTKKAMIELFTADGVVDFRLGQLKDLNYDLLVGKVFPKEVTGQPFAIILKNHKNDSGETRIPTQCTSTQNICEYEHDQNGKISYECHNVSINTPGNCSISGGSWNYDNLTIDLLDDNNQIVADFFIRVNNK
jgi:hypothetical protein